MKARSEPDIVRMIAVGDMMFCGRVSDQIEKHNDYGFPLNQVKGYFQKADIVFGNLETIINDGFKPKKFAGPGIYHCNEKIAKPLHNANISVVNLANNHFYDFGSEAVKHTLNVLKKYNIAWVGIGENTEIARTPIILHRKGMKIGFLGYCSASTAINPKHGFVAAPIKPKYIKEDVTKLSKKTDFVVVSMHEGTCCYPSPEYRKWVQVAVDAGASVVVGHHPHVVNGVEKSKQATIAYGLGNFIADFEGDSYRNTFALDIKFGNDGELGHSIIPIWINDSYQPVLVQNKRRIEIKAYMDKLSDDFLTGRWKKGYYSLMGESYWGMQFREIARSFRAEGWVALVRKIRKVKPSHIILLFKTIIRRILCVTLGKKNISHM